MTPWVTLLVIMIITTGVLVKGLRDSPRASLARLYNEKMAVANEAKRKGDMAKYNKIYNDAEEVYIMIKRLDVDDRERSRHFR